MSLFGKIAAVFSGGSSRSVCVVDGDRMVGGDRVGPSERFQALTKLARFAGREKLDVRVVFGGRPLREAKAGSVYNGIKVYYGDSADNVRKLLKKQLNSAGRSSGLLITTNQKLEDESKRKGFSTMRVSTLRKAMEAGSSERDSGGRNSGRRNRGGRGRGDSRQNRSSQGQRSSDNRNNEPNKESDGDDSVKNLIDLVE